MMLIESAGLTDRGKKREGNEDAFLLDDTIRLYVVADGMGGHLAGEVASRLVVETIHDCLKRCLAHGEADDTVEHIDETISKDANRLLTSIRAANQAVYRKGRQQEHCRGMGSTVAAVCFSDATLIAANVGDSPIYLVRKGEIELLSVTHTVAEEQAALNPAKAQLLRERYHHVLTRAIGAGQEADPDVCEVQCFNEDKVILCSDGLSNKVSPAEMLALVNQHNAQKACMMLVDLANDRGGDDNITVIVLKVAMAAADKNALAGLFLKLKEVLRGCFS